MNRWIVPVALLGVVGLLGYGLVTPPKDPPSVLLGKAAPAFALTDLAGRPSSLSDYQGRPLVINFWASWCQPCHAEAPTLAALSQQVGQNMQFLGILYNDQKDHVAPFNAQYGLTYPTLLDPGSQTAIRYGIGQLPDTFIVDGSGKIVYHHLGAVTDSPQIVDEFKSALKNVGGKL